MSMEYRDAEVSVGGMTLSLRWASRMERLVGRGAPYGAAPWPSSVGLARRLVEDPARVRGRTVVELGCGIGWCSVLCARLGAAHVLATDNEPLVAPIVEENARRNGVEIPFQAYAWRRGTPPPRAQVVIASDVLYDESAEAAFLDAAEACVEPGGVLLLADPGRPSLRSLLQRAEGRGWTARDQPVVVDAARQPGCREILAAHPVMAGPCHVVLFTR